MKTNKSTYFIRLNFSYFVVVKALNAHDTIITSLAVNPQASSHHEVITTGEDKKAKVWKLSKHHGINLLLKIDSWACQHIIEYKEMTPKHSNYSQDGSIVCVVFGQVFPLTFNFSM